MQTLQTNSRGTSVQILQTLLDLNRDGIFGPITRAAVMQLQAKFHIAVDGIVGPQTWCTIIRHYPFQSEAVPPKPVHPKPSLEIKEYFLPNDAYFIKPTKKSWIFLHHTAGWENPYRVIDAWGREAERKVATEFVIGGQSIHNTSDNPNDGKILQAIPNNGWAWHLGIGNQRMHRESIGIELTSFGRITKGYFERRVNGRLQTIELDKNKYYTYLGQEVHRDQVEPLKHPFRDYSYYHRYSTQQLQSLKQLLKHLANEHNIDIRQGLPNLIRKKGAKAFHITSPQMCINTPGIWSHTNVQTTKTDVSPQPELIEMLLSL
ncbi:MAG: N-acetylmuramoyl-L-alanine amidase [Crocinitomicaceae bacterium]|nr:N-acetylmuramoyl-L-alanine amidase [Crocinitomicaceae bacterium]